MTSRERVKAALNHQPHDRVVVDLGGMHCSGAHVSVISGLRQALGLDKPGDPVKICDPYQMLGEVGIDLINKLELDIALVLGRNNMFGFENKDWKKWRTFDGTDVLVPGLFNTDPDEKGNIPQYPGGDKSVRPGAIMPKGGYYFDTVIRQQPIDDSKLDPKDNLEEFTIIPDDELDELAADVDQYYKNTDVAISIGIPGAAFGDIALVPAPFLKNPKGIRDIEEWYVSTLIRKDYIKEVFHGQAEIAIKNMQRIHQAVGNKVNIVNMDGTDLASQDKLFCGPDNYKELYMPYAKRLNDWIHENTEWKTIKHCCGACEPLIASFIEAGYDILNPVQCSAAGMDPEVLVEKYGDDVVFWGGGVDTQKTLPFGTPEEVEKEVKQRVEIFNKKNGFVFNTIHNIQCNTPVENVAAMFRALGRNI